MTAHPEWLDYLRALMALVFVLGLIILSGITLKKTGFDKRLIGNKGPARLSLVETLYLDTRHRIVIVRDGESEHVLLLGATGDLLIASRRGGGGNAA